MTTVFSDEGGGEEVKKQVAKDSEEIKISSDLPAVKRHQASKLPERLIEVVLRNYTQPDPVLERCVELGDRIPNEQHRRNLYSDLQRILDPDDTTVSFPGRGFSIFYELPGEVLDRKMDVMYPRLSENLEALFGGRKLAGEKPHEFITGLRRLNSGREIRVASVKFQDGGEADAVLIHGNVTEQEYTSRILKTLGLRTYEVRAHRDVYGVIEFVEGEEFSPDQSFAGAMGELTALEFSILADNNDENVLVNPGNWSLTRIDLEDGLRASRQTGSVGFWTLRNLEKLFLMSSADDAGRTALVASFEEGFVGMCGRMKANEEAVMAIVDSAVADSQCNVSSEDRDRILEHIHSDPQELLARAYSNKTRDWIGREYAEFWAGLAQERRSGRKV